MFVENIAAVRARYWAALVRVHSVFLTVAFALMVAGGTWGGWLAILLAWSSTTGLLFSLFNMGCALSQAQSLHRDPVWGKRSRQFSRWYSAQRPRVCSVCEQASTLLLVPCVAVILWYMAGS